MKSIRKALGLGLLVWLVPFIITVAFFPFHEPWRALSELTTAVTLATVAIVFGWIYLRSLENIETRDGVLVGIVWWISCVVIDLPLVSAGPMQMSVVEYFACIGLTHVMIPVIAVGGWHMR